MARFFQLDRLTTSTVSHVKPIIFDGDAVLTAQTIKLLDQVTHVQFFCTEVSILGYPEYTFRTLVTLSTLKTALGSGVLAPGTPFVGDATCGIPGGPILVGLNSTLPMIEVARVRNKIKSLTETVLLNPNYLMYVDSITYLDDDLEIEQIGAQLVLNSTPPKQIPTNLSVADVAAFLSPTVLI